MKLFTKILQPLDEAEYPVIIKGFTCIINGKSVPMNKLTQAKLDEMVKQKSGYFDLSFITKSTEPKRTGILRIWPGRFQWTLEQLASKLGKDFEDTDELLEQEITLAFTHGYVQNGQYVQSKQWNLYPTQTQTTNEVITAEDIEDAVNAATE